MSSILLSFVGNQDPFGKEHDEGSIITLTRHLLQENYRINQIILLYAQDHQEAATSTKDWLLSDELSNLNITPENIKLILVDERLSQDPIDFLFAIKEARQALEKAQSCLDSEDFLELNASSGTPAMKSVWSILQAAGYAPKSRVWQVRNPLTKLPEQSRVFETNVDSLKREFDLKIIKQQIEQYDYNGALITFEGSKLVDNGVCNLLRCGSYRLASAFDASFNQIKYYSNLVARQLYTQAQNLAARQHREIIKEIYFQADIKAQTKNYSELLVKLFVFQESVLFYLIKEKLLHPQDINLFDGQNLRNKIKDRIEAPNNIELKNYLGNYRLPNGQRIEINRELNRIFMMAILEYFYERQSEIYRLLQELNEYCQQRNEYIHQLKGVDKIESEEILNRMRKIIKILNLNIQDNPYQILNKQILNLMI